MLISFGWTSAPLLAGAKSFTWRHWSDRYAQQMIDRAACEPPYSILDATDKSPRNGGIKIAKIQLLSVSYADVNSLSDEDWRREGFEWMLEHPESWPAKLWGKPFDPHELTFEAFEERRRSGDIGYDVRFQLVTVNGAARSLFPLVPLDSNVVMNKRRLDVLSGPSPSNDRPAYHESKL